MIEFTAQELHVTGKIDYRNAEQYYAQGLKVIQTQQQYPMTVNLSALEHGSTLALAVLVRWLRQTPNAEGLVFKAVPEKMMKIIQACHLEHDLKLI
ncbi:STAS domain-containing protein [Acinetobacter cumulans]|uniref:STAS domain-containing protein n=1 Tax=Acinetobacter cumulans TaxID=2136182 RepID=A0A3A8G9W4_9GAMM|nr:MULTISPECIES: STAS domain-containing protein [Acinetobacter]NWK72897.1 STAS domain-containing protein [Acinetobacter sp. SwsAc6]QCO20396.1 STAS domain-containing protein [Acinetobacter cumulans]RFS30653.1 STAS domain-containing protein [Acinetobacter sp. SWAC5]RKG43469.1 STAS domain-containing protein [Acinetobacter cumulans]RKG54756.1 STAS domain-containing protein [Acinetobacter cumulans]